MTLLLDPPFLKIFNQLNRISKQKISDIEVRIPKNKLTRPPTYFRHFEFSNVSNFKDLDESVHKAILDHHLGFVILNFRNRSNT